MAITLCFISTFLHSFFSTNCPLNPLSAIWRIYPSSKWSSRWPHDRYIRHGWMTKLRAWEGFGHWRMFWTRLPRDDFRSKLESISFLSRVTLISKSFLFPALFWDLAPNVWAMGLFVSMMSWSFFWKFLSITRHFLRTPTTTMRIFFKYLFFKAEPLFLAWQLWWSPGWAKHFSDRQKLEWKLDFRAYPKVRRTVNVRRDWYESLAVIHGPKEKKHNEVRVWFSEVSTLHRLQNQRGLKNLFPRPNVAIVLPVAVFVYVDVPLQDWSGCSVGTAKESSHSWHFPC